MSHLCIDILLLVGCLCIYVEILLGLAIRRFAIYILKYRREYQVKPVQHM